MSWVSTDCQGLEQQESCSQINNQLCIFDCCGKFCSVALCLGKNEKVAKDFRKDLRIFYLPVLSTL